MRICSLFPSATEIVGALGLVDSLVGVSYECDFPRDVRGKPVVVNTRLPATDDPAEINEHVRELLARGESLYRIESDILRKGEPDLIVTQELCEVCAATPGDLGSALSELAVEPKVLALHPHRIEDVLNDILAVGEATERLQEARELVAGLRDRMAAVAKRIDGVASRPRVLCLEWIDPLMVGGHWVPEMVELAGGVDVLGKSEKPSFRVEWDAVFETRPEVVVIMPCGYGLEKAIAEYRNTSFPDGWNDMPAVRQRRVYAVDANSYFSRPGPRLVTGVDLLVHMFHPEDSELATFSTPSLVAANLEGS